MRAKRREPRDEGRETRRRKRIFQPGLSDRSERPTSHRRLAPLERKKAREEERLKARRRSKGR